MNIDTGKSTWSPAEIDQLRDTVRGMIGVHGVTQAGVARESDVAPATLSQFLNGKYEGQNDRVAAALAKWLDAKHRATEAVRKAPPEPTFVMTPTAEKVIGALEHAQFLGDMAVVVGKPGVGKTAALEQYAANTPRVLFITASPSMSTTNALLAGLIRKYAPRGQMFRSKAERSEAVRDLLASGALLVIDEAQHCSMDALEECRAIHDATKSGLVLMGNATVLSRIEGSARDAAYAQLFSRCGWRVRLDKGDDRDVDLVLDTMGVTAPDVLKLAREINGKDSLRTVVKSVRGAVMLSRAANQNLEPKHLQAAYRRNGGK